MGGQTVYTDQARGFPGQRQGMGHKARSMVNDTGAVRQVHDLTVDNAIDATAYLFTVDLGSGALPIAFTSGAAGTTLTSVRDGLLAVARADQSFENRVAFNPQGVDSIRATALQQGVGFTLADGDANLSNAVVTANAATIAIPFGRAVTNRTGAGTTERSARLPTATGETFAGITERIHSNVDVTNASPADDIGAVAPFSDFTVGKEGEWLVEVDEAVDESSNVFFRHTLGGDAGAVGTFRTDADTARADQITGAKFVSRTTGAGLAVLAVNEA